MTEEQVPRDPTTDDAKNAIVSIIENEEQRVYYSRQLEVRLERHYFHWITNRAVRELTTDGYFQIHERPILGGSMAKFLVPPGFRYFRRSLNTTTKLVRAYSNPQLSNDSGAYAETLFLAGLASAGFVCLAREANEFEGKRWTESNQNLDLIMRRDNQTYGIEIKNRLDYIEHDELESKTRLALHLGLTPMFILRFAPKTYIQEVQEAGGFSLLFVSQIFAPGYGALAKEIKDTLVLPTDSPRAIPDGIIRRFTNWHSKR